MKIRIIVAKCLLILGALCFFSSTGYAQYFTKVYDYDSTSDFGTSISILPNGNYLVESGSNNSTTARNSVITMVISADGSHVINQYGFGSATSSVYTTGALYGRMKRLRSGNYAAPLTYQSYGSTNNLVSHAGLIKFLPSGDTLFTSIYYGPSIVLESTNDCNEASNRDLLIAKERDSSGGAFNQSYGVLARTDSNGVLLWQKRYKKDPLKHTRLYSVEELPDKRILIGACSGILDQQSSGNPYSLDFYHLQPWFILADSAGNILRDTLFGPAYAGGGVIYTDRLGGYIHYGYLDSFLTTNALDTENLPDYVAHLDTNFHVDWRVVFGGIKNRTDIANIKQLANGDFLAIGSRRGVPTGGGWAARISRAGVVKWNRTYLIDSFILPYLASVDERLDGSLIFTGQNDDKTLPLSRRRDVWLLSVDSNGCELPGCAFPTSVAGGPFVSRINLKVYPNPTTGLLNVESALPGTITFYNALGMKVGSYDIGSAATTHIQLPQTMSSGLYIGQFVSGDGLQRSTVRVVYQQ